MIDKKTRLRNLKTELRNRNGRIVNEVSCRKSGYSLEVWILEPGIIVIVQIWSNDSAWELYIPATNENSIPATWAALDDFRDKVRGKPINQPG